MTHSPALDKPGVRLMLNKVPEVTLWFKAREDKALQALLVTLG